MLDLGTPQNVNQTLKRAFNRGLVLDALRPGPASRLAIHRRTRIRLSTVGELVDEMLGANLLTECGSVPRGEGERGRPELLVGLNLDGPYALGVSMDRERLRAGRVNLAGEMLASHELAVAAPDQPSRVVQQIAEAVRAVLPGGAEPLGRCLGLGLSVPGILDAEAGRVIQATAFRSLDEGAPLVQRVREATRIEQVVIGNVANAHLSAERLYGAAAGVKDAVLVLLEPGQIGAAILADGRPLRGAMEASAELGHFKIEPGGPLCACGGRGCLETFIGWRYLRRELIDRGRCDLAEANAEGGLNAFWTSPKAAVAALRDGALQRIGRAVGNLVNLTRPTLVLLSGSLAAHADEVVQPLKRQIAREAMRPFAAHLEVKASALGPRAGVLGGASLVLQQVFAIPQVAAV